MFTRTKFEKCKSNSLTREICFSRCSLLLTKPDAVNYVKSVQIRSFFWAVFSCIRTEYKKIQTRKISVFRYFSRSSLLRSSKLTKCQVDDREPMHSVYMFCYLRLKICCSTMTILCISPFSLAIAELENSRG